jgi:cytochrome c oxidase accessory protein FixG
MSSVLHSIEAPEPVLSTMNRDGSRRWIRPRFSNGRFARRRRITAYALMCVFLAIPYLKVAGRPLLLLDLPHREFTLFGVVFQPTDTLLFMLLFGSALMTVLLFTALFGRVWCGWACPQTVYMEFLFRPIERWIEGGRRGSLRLDRKGGLDPRRLLKYAVYLALALVLAHTFLAYFVRPEELFRWVRESPAKHPTSFFVVLFTTGLVFFDFAYFREQTCLVACPYGRLQSALLDRRSLIVAYDPRRGEPRGRLGAATGDCVDCRMCVQTCPTGIDIRDGLQMECIHCTQCIDACDSVMKRIGRPLGLIRYASRDELEGRFTRGIRPRTIVYPAVLALAFGGLVLGLALRPAAEVTLLRGAGEPYTIEADGTVANQLRLRVANRGPAAAAFSIELVEPRNGRVVAPLDPLTVAPGKTATEPLFVLLPPGEFANGGRDVTFRVRGGSFSKELAWHLVGPER